MRLYSKLTLICCLFLFSQCKQHNGKLATENRNVDAFRKIRLEAAAEVNITNGPIAAITIKGPEKKLEKITTEVKDSQLIISSRQDLTFGNNEFQLDITSPMVNNIELSGAGNIMINSFHVPLMKLSIAGAGNIKFSNSSCDTIYAVVTGAGNMYVNAEKYLDATVKGVGNIEYAGDPVVNSNVSGVGTVKKGK